MSSEQKDKYIWWRDVTIEENVEREEQFGGDQVWLFNETKTWIATFNGSFYMHSKDGFVSPKISFSRNAESIDAVMDLVREFADSQNWDIR